MFLTNNSPDLCFLTLCIKIRQNNLYLASLPRISANLNKKYRPYNFQGLANISGNFWKISGNIKFPENLQPHCQPTTSEIPNCRTQPSNTMNSALKDENSASVTWKFCAPF